MDMCELTLNESRFELRRPNDLPSSQSLPALATFYDRLKYILCSRVPQRGTLERVWWHDMSNGQGM